MDLQIASIALPIFGTMSKYYDCICESTSNTSTARWYFGESITYRIFKRADDYIFASLTFYGVGLQFAQVLDKDKSDNWSLYLHSKKHSNKRIRKLLRDSEFLSKDDGINCVPLMSTEDFSTFLDKLVPLIPPTKGGATKR